MITLRVWFLVNATALVLMMSAWTFAKPAHANQPPKTIPAVGTPVTTDASATGHVSSLGLDSEALQRLLESAEPHRDIYGNEIEDAVTDYRIDPAGAVYERHSPETEVPHLGPPVS